MPKEHKFLADMGISYSTVNWLKENNFDVKHLRDEKLLTLPDDQIIIKAKIEGRIILTCDLDFGDLLAASKDSFPSVILFRLNNYSPININKKLSWILKEELEALSEGVILIVEESRYRIRKLPIRN